MKSTIVVLFMLIASGWAVAQSMEPVTSQDSTCFTCHKPGGIGGGKAMQRLFSIALDSGDSGFGVVVQNAWTSQLDRIEVEVDISSAPSLGFSARPTPLLGQNISGALTGFMEDPMATERTWTDQFVVPAGATDFSLRLMPLNEDESPDFLLKITPPGGAQVTIDAGARGDAESYAMSAPQIPSGAWDVEVEQGGWPASPLDQSRMQDQPFQISWNLWWNVSEADPVRRFSVDGIIEGQEEDSPQNLTIAFPLMFLEPLTVAESIRVRVEADSSHEHTAQSGATDRERIFGETTFTLEPAKDDEPPEVVAPELEPEVVSVESATQWFILGEVLGYTAAFLVAWSLVTGGTFGHWTRRLQDWVSKSPRRRRLNHVVTGFGVLVVAIAHAVLFVFETRYSWSVGWLLGGTAVLAMIALGLTGIFERALIRRFGPESWRWLHFAFAAICVASIVLHIVLDGVHFAAFQQEAGWADPLATRLEEMMGNATA